MSGKHKQSPLTTINQEPARQHFIRVGCYSSDEYREWCRRNGLRDTLNKGAHEREREALLYQYKSGQESLRAARQFQRKPEDVLRALSCGSTAGLAIEKRPFLRFLQNLFTSVQKETRLREAFLRLLLHTHPITDFADDSGTFAVGLLALARHHRDWRQTPESWRPASHNPHRQFRDLARHLLCQYETPPFLLSAFFLADSPATRLKQRWMIQAGNGVSLRNLSSLPLTLTKKMAYLALTRTPEDLSVEEGWRWAQVLGMGGDEKLARTIIATRLGRHFEDEAFWETVVPFFVNHPMLDQTQIGPLVDYLHFERTSPRRAEDRDRLPPGFTLQGRTPTALLARMEAWHGRLAKEARIARESWEPSGIAGYKYGERDPLSGHHRSWSIGEITTAKLLIAEGRAMCHCVATYAVACSRAAVSVWSLRVQIAEGGEPVRVMTIALNRERRISEARGKRNALPSAETGGRFARLSKQEESLLQQGRRIVQRWATAERIGLPTYLNDSVV